MNHLVRSSALVLSVMSLASMTGCLLELDNSGSPGEPGGGGGGGGSNNPPPPGAVRGPQTMSDVHVDQSGEQVWIIHSAAADSRLPALTAHFGAYVPADNTFHEVLDTSGTLGKKILFPAKDRVLLVTQRGTGSDVFVMIDTVARKPIAQRTHRGDRTRFKLSPTGRAVIATDRLEQQLHLLGTANLFDQAIAAGVNDAAWAPGEDVLYVIRTISAGGASSTRLERHDLRTADLGAPIAAPAAIATLPGFGFTVTISPDGRYAAVVALSGGALLSLVDLATGATVTHPSAIFPEFTNDDRAVAWETTPDGSFQFSLVDAATGRASPPVPTGFQALPSIIALRRSDALVAVPGASSDDAPAFLYDVRDGKRTPLSSPIEPASVFERAGHPELWIWQEEMDALSRVDLTTGTVVDLVRNVDSVDYRAAADDIVVGTFLHSVHRISMATGRPIGSAFVLPDPNDVRAPFALTAE